MNKGISKFLSLALVAIGFFTMSERAIAAVGTYPDRPVKLVVGFPPGGANDMFARLLSKKLTEIWPNPVIVDNKPGANGSIALQYIANAVPDGYTIGLSSVGPMTMNAALQELPFDILEDFTPIINLADAPHVLAVNTELPVNTVREFVDMARTASPSLTYASAGVGNSTHFAMEVFIHHADIDMLHVPYKGAAAAFTDLIAGRAHAFFGSAPSLLGHVEAGKVKILGVSSENRLPRLPDVPTMKEEGFAVFEFPLFGGIVAPAGLPKEIVDLINRDINKVLQDPEFVGFLEENAMVVEGGSAEDFSLFLEEDLNRWKKVVRDANLKAE